MSLEIIGHKIWFIDSLIYLAQADLAGSPWDKCTKAGTFKSVSFCYQSSSRGNISRYDYYVCSPSGSSFVLYKYNCPGPQVVYMDGMYMVFKNS